MVSKSNDLSTEDVLQLFGIERQKPQLSQNSLPNLKPSIRIRKTKDNALVFLSTPREYIKIPDPDKIYEKLINVIDGCHTIPVITELVNQDGISIEADKVLEHLNLLYQNLIIEDNHYSVETSQFPDDWLERYQRQFIFFQAFAPNGKAFAVRIQKQLYRKHVVILGVGGVGSQVLYGLNAVGIGKITLVDFDTVELSNLNRQSMYNESDLGSNKIKALQKSLPQMNSKIDFRYYNQKMASLDDIKKVSADADLIINCADSPLDKIYEWVNQTAFENNIPTLFTIGATKNYIRCGPLVNPGTTACFQCSMNNDKFMDHDLMTNTINEQAVSGAFAPYILVLGGIMVLEVLKHLTDFQKCQLYNRILLFNPLTYTISFKEFTAQDNCPFCGKKR